MGPLVDVLLRCRAQDYLGFRLVHRSGWTWCQLLQQNRLLALQQFVRCRLCLKSLLCHISSSGSTLAQTRLRHFCSGLATHLTLKAVPGWRSYVWREGRAVAVPASRSDVFRDRSMAPVEKRALMRFLKATVDAISGEGDLRVCTLFLVCYTPAYLEVSPGNLLSRPSTHTGRTPSTCRHSVAAGALGACHGQNNKSDSTVKKALLAGCL